MRSSVPLAFVCPSVPPLFSFNDTCTSAVRVSGCAVSVPAAAALAEEAQHLPVESARACLTGSSPSPTTASTGMASSARRARPSGVRRSTLPGAIGTPGGGPEMETSATRSTRSGICSAAFRATPAPIDTPTSRACSTPRWSSTRRRSSTVSNGPMRAVERPWPRWS
jgi:hypothetical protein